MTEKKRRFPRLLYLSTAVILLILAGITLWSNSLRVPSDSLPAPDELDVFPASYADYLVIPYNIAPLNFSIKNEAYDYITCLSAPKGDPILIKGNDVDINTRRWKKMLDANKGEALLITVYVKRDGVWFHFPTITYQIAAEPIDTWVVYRMTQPAYTDLGDITLIQRNLESFKEKILYKNQRISNLKNPSLATTLFPAFHPLLDVYASAVDKRGKSVPFMDSECSNAFDAGSNLCLKKTATTVEKNAATGVFNESILEAFPSWSKDGKQLFSSIAVVSNSRLKGNIPPPTHFNLVRRLFNPSTMTIGFADTLVNALQLGKSAVTPRISPDGKQLLFCMTENGNAPLWDKSSDIYIMDIKNGSWRQLDVINSPSVDNQPCWSSNGRWIIFGSNRLDGTYTRLYMAYFDKDGLIHKPFVLPQQDPTHDEQSFRSSNTPEFISTPTTTGQLRLLVYLLDMFDNN